MSSPEWMDRALCREVDPELFFPDRPANMRIERFRQAVAICQRCEVRSDCYRYAYDNNVSDGVWGGHYATNIRKAKRKGVTL